MERLVIKMDLPYVGETYMSNIDSISYDTLKDLQEPLKKLYQLEELEDKGLLLKLSEEEKRENDSQHNNGWNLVSERLPKKEWETYITSHEDGSVQIHSYTHKDGFVLDGDTCKPKSNVIAWQPFPEPYKED